MTIKIDFENKEHMTDREIAFIMLANKCGKVLANANLYPEDIFNISYNYLFNGCKSRGDYEYLVTFLFENNWIRVELLK